MMEGMLDMNLQNIIGDREGVTRCMMHVTIRWAWRTLLQLCVIMTILALLCMPTRAYATETMADTMSMEISYGYDNNAKAGRYIPITVTCTSVEAFTGYVSFYTRESDEKIYEYSYPISIEADGTVTETYYVHTGERASQIQTFIEDEDGNKVLAKRINLNTNATEAALYIGILCDTPDRLGYFDNAGVNYGLLRTKTFIFTEQNFPEVETGLDMLDVIIISSYRIRNLSDTQTRVLMDWVKSGGVLVLGTGQRADDTLGRFAPELLDDMYEAATGTLVNLLYESTSDSTGTNITLPMINVKLHGGNVVLSGETTTLITSTNRGEGVIAVASFDFVDIDDYANMHNSFVDTMLSHVLGETRMESIASEAYSSNNSVIWSVSSLINSTTENIPEIGLYVIFILGYIFIVGPFLYIFLRNKNLSSIYIRCVILSSIVFAIVIYFMGSATRFDGTFYSYATIMDMSEDTKTEVSYVCVQNPNNEPYEFALDASYSLLPITNHTINTSYEGLTENSESSIDIDYLADETRVSIKDAMSFAPKYFRLDKGEENADGAGFVGYINLFDGEITGEVTNALAFDVKDAFIIMYGKIVIIGDMESGQSISLDDIPIYNIPLGSTFTLSKNLMGLDETRRQNKELYLETLRNTNLLSFYLENYISGYTADAYMVAFSSSDDEPSFIGSADGDISGSKIYTSVLSVNSKDDGVVYRSAMITNPTVLSGNYFVDTNTMYAGEPVSLEYSLGTDINIEGINFENVSYGFRDGINIFNGTISFYNYRTAKYEDQEIPYDMEDINFDISTLRNYISPSNTINIRYSASSNTGSQPDITLPMVFVIGTEK